jgi:hypothetical protein
MSSTQSPTAVAPIWQVVQAGQGLGVQDPALKTYACRNMYVVCSQYRTIVDSALTYDPGAYVPGAVVCTLYVRK